MTSRLRLTDPTPSVASEVERPNYFETEVRLFQVGVRLAAESGFVTPSFPLSAIVTPASPEPGSSGPASVESG